jgi:hypothetical protein
VKIKTAARVGSCDHQEIMNRIKLHPMTGRRIVSARTGRMSNSTETALRR